MHVTWLDPDQPDSTDLAQAVAVLEEARLADAPQHLSPTLSGYAGHLRCGWDGDAPLGAVARDENGAAVVEVHLPSWDNKHLGFVSVTVDPAVRRQGIGREVFSAGVERLRAAGRTLLGSECLAGGAGVPFLETMGLLRASRDVWRRQDVQRVAQAPLAEQFASAERAARGYELLRIPVPVPNELVSDVVAITDAINDAPRDDLELEDEVFSAERIRAFEAAQAAQRRRIYRLAVRDTNRGGLAVHTIVAVDGEHPWHGWQYDTSVLREHRGHRLGILLKIGMLRWLAAEEPQLRRIDTWNAASNDHMIAINELLGYRVVVEGITWQRRL